MAKNSAIVPPKPQIIEEGVIMTLHQNPANKKGSFTWDEIDRMGPMYEKRGIMIHEVERGHSPEELDRHKKYQSAMDKKDRSDLEMEYYLYTAKGNALVSHHPVKLTKKQQDKIKL